MQYALYFFIAILATTAGAITGLGGGIIIKPVLDALGHYDVATIGALSSITVFSMALVSVGKQLQQKARVSVKIAIPLAIGSVIGGNLGQKLLSVVLVRLSKNSIVITQNSILLLLVAAVFLYMFNKANIPPLGADGVFPALAVGLLLGILASFLGIGGGPINVALLIYIFSFNTKRAAFCSIITILFSQASKLVLLLIEGNLGSYDLSMLPAMVVGAIAGGFIGAKLQKGLTEKGVERAFSGMQLVVLCICTFNIVTNLSR